MTLTKNVAGALALTAAGSAMAGPTVPLGVVSLGVSLGAVLGDALGFVLGRPLGSVLGGQLGAVLPVTNGTMLMVATASLALGIALVRRKQQR